MNNIKYVGMDVHKSITVIVVLNELGQFESRSQIKTKGENICDFFRGISGKVGVVFEECTHSAWLYKLLKPLVASVTVCDPRHNKLIEDGNKSDDEDAETLAIAVLEHGHIIELGTHEELMGRNGLYTRLYSMQFRDPEEELAWLLVKLHDKQADGNPRNAPSLRIPSLSEVQQPT